MVVLHPIGSWPGTGGRCWVVNYENHWWVKYEHQSCPEPVCFYKLLSQSSTSCWETWCLVRGCWHAAPVLLMTGVSPSLHYLKDLLELINSAASAQNINTQAWMRSFRIWKAKHVKVPDIHLYMHSTHNHSLALCLSLTHTNTQSGWCARTNMCGGERVCGSSLE